MIEQKERAKVPAQKMKQYSGAGKHPGAEGKQMERPEGNFPMKNQADGSMDYVSKTDGQTSADAKKINNGFYKFNRYK